MFLNIYNDKEYQDGIFEIIGEEKQENDTLKKVVPTKFQQLQEQTNIFHTSGSDEMFFETSEKNIEEIEMYVQSFEFDTPTTKVVGFLFHRVPHDLVRLYYKAIGCSLTHSPQAYFLLVRTCPALQYLFVYAMSSKPLVKIFIAAFTSLSCMILQLGHSQLRTDRSFTYGCLYPHT